MKHKLFKVGDDNCRFLVTSYANNGNMAVIIETEDGEPYIDLTVNLDYLMPFYAFVNTNNSLKLDKLLEKYKFAKPTGAIKNSGFCKYPLYEFDLEKMQEYISPLSDYLFLSIGG